MEKLYHEEMALAYSRDFPLVTRMARFHNVYGPFGKLDTQDEIVPSMKTRKLMHVTCVSSFAGTWKGGREKAPAAFCRKAVGSTTSFEVWGDGEQTRSFMFVDDCVEGVIRIMMSDFDKPLNLGTEEMVSMNEFAEIAMSFEDKKLPIKNVPGPQGMQTKSTPSIFISLTTHIPSCVLQVCVDVIVTTL